MESWNTVQFCINVIVFIVLSTLCSRSYLQFPCLNDNLVSILAGWFPGPVIFGALVDSTCIIWRTTCGSVGACSLYDIQLFRLRMHGLTIGLRIITLFFYILALIFSLCSKVPVFQPQVEDITIAVTANGHQTKESQKTGTGSKTCVDSDNKETYI